MEALPQRGPPLPIDTTEAKKESEDPAAPPTENLRKDVLKFVHKKQAFTKTRDYLQLRSLKKADQHLIRSIRMQSKVFGQPNRCSDEELRDRNMRRARSDKEFVMERFPQDVARNEEHDHTPLVLHGPREIRSLCKKNRIWCEHQPLPKSVRCINLVLLTAEPT
jgi:hypothetical protein